MQVTDETNSVKDKKTFVILTCDGGGVRAFLQLLFLEQLAKDIGFPITDVIDSATLCSGGAITGLSLIAKDNQSNSNNTPLFTEIKAREIFETNAAKIFPQPKEGKLTKIFNQVAPPSFQTLLKTIKTLWKIHKQNGIFSSDNQAQIFYDLFGNLKAKETVKPFFIPTTDFRTGSPIWLTNLKGIENSHMIDRHGIPDEERIYYVPEMRLADVLLSSIRPPILFDLKMSTIKYREKDENGRYRDGTLDIVGTDGAFYAASPETHAYDLAVHWLENIKKMKRDEYRIVLLSIGTGRKPINNDIDDIKILDPLAQIETIKKIALVLPYRAGQGNLRSRVKGNGDLYIRFDADMNDEDPNSPSDSLSDASPENIRRFKHFVQNHFVSGNNTKEYNFTIQLLKALAEKQDIEHLVQQRLGEKYWPLREKANTSDKKQPKKGWLESLLPAFVQSKNSSANQNEQQEAETSHNTSPPKSKKPKRAP